MSYKIINAISSSKVPAWGNQKKYIAIHYLGVVGQSHGLASDGCGAHFYIYWDGTIYQRCSLDAIPWAVGTAGYYTQKHPQACNKNTISIEMCCKCDGNASSAEDKKWYFTTETQEACAWLVQKLMKEQNISLDHVLRHYDIVNKTCPAPYVHNNKYKTSWTWDEFKAKVAGKEISSPEYHVGTNWLNGTCVNQIGAYSSLENAKNACLPGYTVYDLNGKMVYTVKAKGTQAISLTGLTEKQKIEKMAPLYQACQKETGMLASVGLAQFCLESGYGTTDLAINANNLHGMKCELSGNNWPNSSWNGKCKYTKSTAEQDKNGNVYYVKADFRKYDCMEDSIMDRAAYFIGAMNGSKKRYPDINKITDAETQVKLIKSGGYATDVNYVKKLTSVIDNWNLTQYDLPDKDTFKVGVKYTLLVDNYLRLNPASGYVKYRDLATSTQKKCVQLSNGHAKLKAGNTVTALEVKVLDNGNIWIRIKNGWIAAVVNKKARLEEYVKKETTITTPKEETFKSYSISITASDINIRSGAGTNYSRIGYTSKGNFTIVDEMKDSNSRSWGLLKSYEKKRNGWIALWLNSVHKN